MATRDIQLIAHDIRSSHNIGALLRTAECLGVSHVYITGYSPYPASNTDTRLPHLAAKIDRQIHKTALGAEKLVPWSRHDDVVTLLTNLADGGYVTAALEQSPSSITLPDYKPPQKIVLLLGREVDGIEPALLDQCQITLEIPQFGQKESLNVVEAASMALYHLRFTQ